MHSALTNQTHRPWPIPAGPWIMTQQWCDLLFAHWPIAAETMRALVPRSLQLDLWQDQAWVGVVPFRMQGVRPRGIPALPWLSSFEELNVRTYVTMRDRGQEKPGVYFFSLEAANPLAVTLARTFFKLPYFHAQMALQDDGQIVHYSSVRTHRNAPTAEFSGSYQPTGPVYRSAAGSIDAWLTERYALYTTDAPDTDTDTGTGRAYIGEIHHKPWPLQAAQANFVTNTVTVAAASELALPNMPPLLHFVRHIDVVVWPLRKVE